MNKTMTKIFGGAAVLAALMVMASCSNPMANNTGYDDIPEFEPKERQIDFKENVTDFRFRFINLDEKDKIAVTFGSIASCEGFKLTFKIEASDMKAKEITLDGNEFFKFENGIKSAKAVLLDVGSEKDLTISLIKAEAKILSVKCVSEIAGVKLTVNGQENAQLSMDEENFYIRAENLDMSKAENLKIYVTAINGEKINSFSVNRMTKITSEEGQRASTTVFFVSKKVSADIFEGLTFTLKEIEE